MRLQQISLLFAAVGYALVGLAFLIAPAALAPHLDIVLLTATARSDLRSLFGGLQVGLGAFFALSLTRPAWSRPALGAQALTFGGLGLARLVSLLVDGVPEPVIWVLWGGELFGAALALLALRRTAAPGAPVPGRAP